MAQTLHLKSVNGEIIKIKVKQDPAFIITGQTAVSGALNLSSEGLFAQNNNGILEFKGLQASNGITLTPSSTGVTIGYSGGSGNYITEATFTGYTATTETRLNGIEDDITYLSGQTTNKLNTSVFNAYTGVTQTELNNINSELDLAITGVTAGANLSAIQTGRVVNITFTGSTGGGDVTHSELDPWTGATDSRIDLIEAGYITGGTNVGNGVNIYGGLVATKLLGFRTLNVTSPLSITSGATEITIGYTGSTDYVSNTKFNSYTGATETRLNGIEDDITYLSGQTSNKLNTSVFNAYTASTDSILDGTITGVTAGANLSAIQTGRVVNITFTGSTGGGSITGATNVGSSGEGVFKAVNGDDLEFKKIKVSTPLYISGSTNEIHIQFTGSTGGGGAYLPLSGGTLTGNLLLTGNTLTANNIQVDRVSGTTRDITFLSGGLSRWILRTDSSTESGSNEGSNFGIVRRSDAGSNIETALTINRSSGIVQVAKAVAVFNDTVTLTGNTTLNATYAGKTIEANGTFTITFPNSMETGMKVNIINVGTGIITIAASTTLQSKNTYTKLAYQYGGASVYHRGSNIWLAVGDLTF